MESLQRAEYRDQGTEMVDNSFAESTNIKASFYPESEPRLQTSVKPDDVKSPNTVEKTSERMLKLGVQKISE
jgi:hypothetical protein